MVRHQVLVLAFGGSSPSSPAMRLFTDEKIALAAIFSFFIIFYSVGVFQNLFLEVTENTVIPVKWMLA